MNIRKILRYINWMFLFRIAGFTIFLLICLNNYNEITKNVLFVMGIIFYYILVLLSSKINIKSHKKKKVQSYIG